MAGTAGLFFFVLPIFGIHNNYANIIFWVLTYSVLHSIIKLQGLRRLSNGRDSVRPFA